MNGTPALFDDVLRVLCRSLSPINARGALERALGRLGVQPEALSTAHLPALVRELRVAMRLFLDPSQTAKLLQEIDALSGHRSGAVTPVRVEVTAEADVSHARRAARDLCDRVRARTFASQKILTIVSELSRNIAVYSHGGSLELVGEHREPRESEQPGLRPSGLLLRSAQPRFRRTRSPWASTWTRVVACWLRAPTRAAGSSPPRSSRRRRGGPLARSGRGRTSRSGRWCATV